MISLLALILQATAPAPAPVAPWTVVNRTSQDGKVHSTLVAVPSNENNGRLLLRCDAGAEKVVSVQFLTSTLGGAPDRPVTLMIDNSTPMGTNWQFIPQGAYESDDTAVTTLTTAIAGGKVIKVHTTTTTGTAVDATFAGPPGAAPVTAVLTACGYTLGAVPVRAPKPAPTPAK